MWTHRGRPHALPLPLPAARASPDEAAPGIGDGSGPKRTTQLRASARTLLARFMERERYRPEHISRVLRYAAE